MAALDSYDDPMSGTSSELYTSIFAIIVIDESWQDFNMTEMNVSKS